MKLQMEVEVTNSRISDILCDAFEGGSNYWIASVSYYLDGKHLSSSELREEMKNRYYPLFLETKLPTEEMEYPPYIWLPLVFGGELGIMASDGKSDEDKEFRLGVGTIRAGLVTMAQKYPKHFADIINENDDAITGDVFLQCCLFGETIYG